MIAEPDGTTTTDAELAAGAPAPAGLRGVETQLLLHAVTALRLDGSLSEDEYRAKRRRLTARR